MLALHCCKLTATCFIVFARKGTLVSPSSVHASKYTNMHSYIVLTLLSVAGGALAACGGASGCCCRDFGPDQYRRSESTLWVKPGTTEEEIKHFLANE